MRSAVILVNADHLCGCIERNLAALGPFAVTVARNVVVFTEAAHTLLSPSVAVTRRLARTIEETCNLPIRHQSGQLTHESYGILRRWPMMPARRVQS